MTAVGRVELLHYLREQAAQFLASYGGPANRILSAASRPFLEAGADGLADSELISGQTPQGLPVELANELRPNRFHP